jgi:glycosyltransferase involved in cell wall biosynthesis
VTARGAIADIWNHTNCHAYTAISKGMAALNQPYTDVEIEVVRNSIEVGRYSPPAERAAGAPIVAFAGRTTSHEKNFARFTRIAQHLVAQGARVWIADPHEAGWDRFTAPNVAKFPVERWQRVSHADMPDFYRAIAASGGVLVITSMSEGFGNVAPEAAACGARVAAHDVIGLREAVVDGVTGRLFPISMSEIDVAAMLERWLAEPHDMMAVSEATKREYSPSVMVEGYLSAYARPKARLVTAKLPPPADTPELKHLLGHLRDQGNWRAQFEREAAVHLMRASYKRRAVAALGMAFRAAPGQFLGPSAARQVITIGRGLIGGVGGGRS